MITSLVNPKVHESTYADKMQLSAEWRFCTLWTMPLSTVDQDQYQ